MLTLSAWVYSSVKGEVGNGGKHGGGRRPVAGKTTTIAAILSPRARLPGGGGRGRRGGAFAPAGSAPGGSNRRRRAAAHTIRARSWRLRVRDPERGEKGGEERQVVAESVFILRGGARREEGAGEATATAIVAAVYPLSPQRKKLTGRAPCQCFNIFCFPIFKTSRLVAFT